MGRLRAISVLLLISGTCALVFQTAWIRELKLIFGATTPATAAVIAIFMGGLGAGNAILGPRADRSPNPLRFYALIELRISALTALSPLSIWLVRALYIAGGGQETFGLAGATVLRLLLAALVLGPQVFLMGATVPAAVRAAISADDVSRRGVGLLYGMNTIGAVVGVLLGTFLLLECLGTRATLWLACAVNLINAAAAWQISKKLSQRPQTIEREQASSVVARSASEEVCAGELPAALIYAIAFTTGFSFFLMELVWYRMLGPILGGTTFTFGLILAVALAGIGLGGVIYPLVTGYRRPGLSALALTLGLEALAIAIPYALGDQLAILAGVLRPLAAIGFSSQVFGWLLVASIVMLPAAVVSGVQFPLLVALLGTGERQVGAQLGRTLAWNTVGAMIGALAGGFGLMGLLSALGTWVLSVVVLAASAVVVAALAFRRTH